MPLNLIELIKASGSTGVSGQSFKGNVLPKQSISDMTGFKMSDYKISSLSFSGSIPVSDAGTYANNSSFTVTATFVRGTQAYRIQRNESAAWSIGRWGSVGDPFTATITGFTSNSSGASHTITFQLSAPATGSKSVSTSVNHSGSQPSGTNPWPVQWTASIGVGTGGTATIAVHTNYDPDTANFNQSINNRDNNDIPTWNNIPITRGQYTVSDYEIEWHYGAGMGAYYGDSYDIDVAPAWNSGSLLSTATTYGTSIPIFNRHLVYPDTDPEVGLGTRNTPTQGVAVLWLRWRGVGDSTWNYPIQTGYSAYPGRWIKYDPRQAQ